MATAEADRYSSLAGNKQALSLLLAQLSLQGQADKAPEPVQAPAKQSTDARPTQDGQCKICFNKKTGKHGYLGDKENRQH